MNCDRPGSVGVGREGGDFVEFHFGFGIGGVWWGWRGKSIRMVSETIPLSWLDGDDLESGLQTLRTTLRV